MIVIIDTLLFAQPIVAVVDDEYTPSKILSLRKGSFSDGSGHHETSVAKYHAEKYGQRHVENIKLYDESELTPVQTH